MESDIQRKVTPSEDYRGDYTPPTRPIVSVPEVRRPTSALEDTIEKNQEDIGLKDKKRKGFKGRVIDPIIEFFAGAQGD